MNRPKGKALHDKFYYKVQASMLDYVVNQNVLPVVTDWSETSYFITSDRVTFYIIPKMDYYLSEKFIYPCKKLFQTDEPYVQNLYLKNSYEVKLTGNQFATGIDNKTVVLEISTGDGVMYIKQSSLSLFPKQHIFCMSQKPKSPILVLSSLKTLLGGVWPFNSSKIVEN